MQSMDGSHSACVRGPGMCSYSHSLAKSLSDLIPSQPCPALLYMRISVCDFAKLGMWLQTELFPVVVPRQARGTPPRSLPLSAWHCARALRGSSSSSPSCWQIILFLPFSVDSSLSPSLLFIALGQIVEAKSDDYPASRGGVLRPTTFNNLLSQDMMAPFFSLHESVRKSRSLLFPVAQESAISDFREELATQGGGTVEGGTDSRVCEGPAEQHHLYF